MMKPYLVVAGFIGVNGTKKMAETELFIIQKKWAARVMPLPPPVPGLS
jgi:hypothetical protein